MGVNHNRKLAVLIHKVNGSQCIEPRHGGQPKMNMKILAAQYTSFELFGGFFYTFNLVEMNLIGCFSMYLLLIIVELLILIKITKVRRPTKNRLPPIEKHCTRVSLLCEKWRKHKKWLFFSDPRMATSILRVVLDSTHPDQSYQLFAILVLIIIRSFSSILSSY